MKTLKLLKDYGEFKTGDLVDVNEADAKTLIDDGIAEAYIVISKHADGADPPEDPTLAAAKAAVELIKDSDLLKSNEKIPAQPKDPDETYVFKGKQFFRAVMEKDMGVIQPYLNFREEKVTGASEGVDTDGGFLVPTEISNDIFEGMKREANIRPACTDTPINHSIERPYVDDFDKSSSWYAGIATYWVGEGVAPTISNMKFGKYRLQLKKLGAYLAGTEELLADSVTSFEQMVTTGASYALAKEIDEQIINGTGAGRPMGVMNANCLVSVTKETGQAATTIVTENVLKMRMRCSNFARASWYINDDCFDQIYQMSLAVGTGGAPMMLVNLRDGTEPRILGRPIVWCDNCQTLGTTGDIILADFSQYNTASKAGQPGVKGQSSIHVKFLEGEQVFRFTIRVDGQPMWYEELTPKHGSNTVSPFVALASRT
jgi:HK97 family phage major capsid protein